MSKTETIVFTGGGTAGHVVVNLALMPEFIEEGYDIHYIGSYEGIERELLEGMDDVTYHGIATGKLRRYMSLENMKDPFRVLKGLFQARQLLKKLKPKLVFSKGGFVSVPVVMASRLTGVPSIIHESDYTPGLANKIASNFAKYVLTTFPESDSHLPEKKAVNIGAIVRNELFEGDPDKAAQFTGLNKAQPTLLVMGGSAGAQSINQAVRDALPQLLKHYQVIHLCGKGKYDEQVKQPGYVQYEYVTDELKDLLALSDLVVSRAGANSIFEFLALRKPMLLIPLSKQASRGDQLLNAESFKKRGYADVLEDESVNASTLTEAVDQLYSQKEHYHENMTSYQPKQTKEDVINMIKRTMK
ncbi:undecaprenyldiphospho-muramoylpentapeptide beta-N-acetylglucosaminyltransferase [Alkalibacillus almallahensis]|uniref:undecaprenyldiphospho-muramoylpentapeptide beta-N-acetylglucosaminyltransferase n=1 Tax=Alkalibacillus almallahensis TaxID=1379154 RepID=UPI00141F4929|nr:undecaprenyldiphospho-muramoylpentapeptide beta-N-acetylglucosaminyltransferase [Alkalibacillus almallahensis]NIK13090.1 UDP-N-acetylglucosamine--N-acetylmuramyl-(pentapeptide) pyrophosphoryl-undecaprenol N-acetylglucosamine transferase [Alkalibacillus almallahensis]